MADAFALRSPEAPVRTGAEISPCGRYRYHLSREWDPSLQHVAFVLLNPSTADGHEDDPTVRRCVGFARHWGYGGIRIVNLFPLRATDPKALRTMQLPADVNAYARDTLFLTAANAARVVCGWGDSGGELARLAGEAVVYEIKRRRRHVPPSCLGRTKRGQPKHPLYLPYDAALEPYGGAHG